MDGGIAHLTDLSVMTIHSVLLDPTSATDPIAQRLARQVRLVVFGENTNIDNLDAVARALDEWLASGLARDMVIDDPDLGIRTCDPRVAQEIIAGLYDPWTLALMAGVGSHNMSMSRLQEGGFDKIVSLEHVEGHDRLMMPLTEGAYWTGDALMLAPQMLPETVIQASVGRKAKEIVDHALLEDASIIGTEKHSGGWSMLLLNDAQHMTWREFAGR